MFVMKSIRSGVIYLSTVFLHVAFVYAQLPDFLTTQKEQNAGSVELEVSYDGNQVFDGEQFGVDEVQTLPSFAMCDSCGISTSSKYIIAMIDIDLPSSDSATNAPQFLHYLRPGFQIADGTWLNSTVSPAVQYTPPAPPAGTGPHRYVWLLYNQPLSDDFSLQGVPGSTQERAKFDVQAWEEQNGFTDGPEWAVYFVAEEGVRPTRTTTTLQAPTSTTSTTLGATGAPAPTTVFVTVTPSTTGNGEGVVPTETPGGTGADNNNGALSRFGEASLLVKAVGIVAVGAVFVGW